MDISKTNAVLTESQALHKRRCQHVATCAHYQTSVCTVMRDDSEDLAWAWVDALVINQTDGPCVPGSHVGLVQQIL